MKIELKNIAYAILGVVITTIVLNPTIAYKIKSNLVAGFQAIKATDIKVENNLVALGADAKLPTDIIPASAVTAGGGNSILFLITKFGSTTYPSCPAGFDVSYSNPGTKLDVSFRSASWVINGNGSNFIKTIEYEQGCNYWGGASTSSTYRSSAYNRTTSKVCRFITTCIKVY